MIRVASEEEAILKSLELNKADPAALWLFAYDAVLGWYIENWRALAH